MCAVIESHLATAMENPLPTRFPQMKMACTVTSGAWLASSEATVQSAFAKLTMSLVGGGRVVGSPAGVTHGLQSPLLTMASTKLYRGRELPPQQKAIRALFLHCVRIF